MEINTRDFGPVSVEEDAVYTFPEGVYGFEEERTFAVFRQSIEGLDFLYLQSASALDPCFLIFEPWDLFPGYAPAISKEDLAALDASGADDLILLAIATVPSRVAELSINVKSPVALNPKTRKGRQVILQNTDYPIRYQPFLPASAEGKEDASC